MEEADDDKGADKAAGTLLGAVDRCLARWIVWTEALGRFGRGLL